MSCLRKVLYKVLSNDYNQDFTLPIHFKNTPYGKRKKLKASNEIAKRRLLE